MPKKFKNRREVAELLAKRLAEREERYVFLGIPPGGLAIALELSGLLDAPADVMGVHLISAPDKPDVILGAVGPEGVIVIDKNAIEGINLSEEEVEQIVAQERSEMRRRVRTYRGEEGLLDVEGKTAVVVDDAFERGIEALAAVRSLRSMNAGRVFLAVAVCASDVVEIVGDLVDEVICLSRSGKPLKLEDWFEELDGLTSADLSSRLLVARKRFE